MVSHYMCFMFVSVSPDFSEKNGRNEVDFLVFGLSLGQHVVVCACSLSSKLEFTPNLAFELAPKKQTP